VWLQIIQRIVDRSERPYFDVVITANWARQHIKTSTRTKATKADHGAKFRNIIILPLVRRSVKPLLNCLESCGNVIGGVRPSLLRLLNSETPFTDDDTTIFVNAINTARRTIWRNARLPLPIVVE